MGPVRVPEYTRRRRVVISGAHAVSARGYGVALVYVPRGKGTEGATVTLEKSWQRVVGRHAVPSKKVLEEGRVVMVIRGVPSRDMADGHFSNKVRALC